MVAQRELEPALGLCRGALVIADDVALARLVRRVLLGAAFDSIEVRGSELNRWPSEPVDLVAFDVQYPISVALRTYADIRRCAATARAPLLLLTAPSATMLVRSIFQVAVVPTAS